MKLKYTLLALAAMTGAASAAAISVNFADTGDNREIAPATSAGIGNFTNWNNTVGVSGTAGSLIDSDGATTMASVTWSAPGTWNDSEAEADASAGVGNAQLMRGYLDDGNAGAAGADWTVTGIPYTNYTAILYLATDTAGGSYREFNVNGTNYSTTGTKQRYGTQPNWDATNSITVTGLSGDLVVDGLNRDGAIRGSVAGFQIVEVPEPSSTALLGLGGLALILRRRK
ncbi:PEP-CTERM sorting domain-containing protein [Oceaniferula spumae]